MLEPGKGAGSNLVRALEGRPLIVRAADGTTKEQEFSRMPPKGAPVPEADIARIRRWIDHGAPRDRPAVGSTPAPSPSTAGGPAVPAAAPTGETRVLTPVGSDSARLGSEGAGGDGDAAPAAFVARTEAEWAALFTTRIAGEGPNGPRVAKALGLLRDMAKGYDFASAPLLLLVGPVTDNYAVEGTPTLELLSDGSARGLDRPSPREAHVRRPRPTSWPGGRSTASPARARSAWW